MSLTISAPVGAEFVFEEVKTAKGTQSLGEVPILVWHDLDAAIAHYGAEGITRVLDGTSLRVSFQAIARRGAEKGKTSDEIGQAQVDFRPGNRATAVSTPVSRAKRAAGAAAEKVGGDTVEALLAKIASGEIDPSAFL